MIGTIYVRCNAAHPENALPTMASFVGSPSSIRVLDVPKKIGSWQINAVQLNVVYPDTHTHTIHCQQASSAWVGTLPPSTEIGESKKGFTITASGTDENGNAVSGYVLGVGDISIIGMDGQIIISNVAHYMHFLSAEPDIPQVADAYSDNGIVKLYDGNGWIPLKDMGEYLLSSDFANLSGNFLTAHQSLSDYYTKDETYSYQDVDYILTDYLDKDYFRDGNTIQIRTGDNTKVCDFGGNYLRQLEDSIENCLTAETDPLFARLSSNFLTAHQSLSDYYMKNETSSCAELSSALSAKADTVKHVPDVIQNIKYEITRASKHLSAVGMVLEFAPQLSTSTHYSWTVNREDTYPRLRLAYSNGTFGISWASNNATTVYGLSSDPTIGYDNYGFGKLELTKRLDGWEVVYADSLSGFAKQGDLSSYATNDKVDSLSSDYIKRNANTITTPGVVTDYLASNLVGGVRVRFSAHNLDNYTAYAYSGVAVRRNASTDDYLFDSSQNGIARMKDISAIVEAYLAQNAG